MHITTDRTMFTDTTSSGVIRIDGQYFCESLEDTARAYGVKVPNKTCIPSGEYKVTITPSERFKRPMILLYSNPQTLACELGNVKFTGVRVHGGNTHEDSAGCILAAFTRVSPERIKGSAESALYDRVKMAMDVGDPVTWTIRNVPQP